MKKLTREDVLTAIADNYIEKITSDYVNYNDVELLNSMIRGDGFTPFNLLTDEQLITEYIELFNERIEIVSI